MNEQKNYYAIIPAGVRYDKSLPLGARLLYGEITALCNQSGMCWAGNEYFAELYKKDERTVIRWINALIKGGYIMRNFRYDETGKKVVDRCLTLVEAAQIQGDKNVVIVVTKMSKKGDKNVVTVEKGGDKNVTENNTINKYINNNIYAQLTLSELIEKCFNKFYEIYPRHVGKKEAYKKYTSIFQNSKTKEIALKKARTILDGLLLAVAVWEKRFGQDKTYIPHPATWLNGERWTDEYEVPQTLEEKLYGGEAI